MNARRVSSLALAKDDTLRRVAPDEACGVCQGRKPVGFTLLALRSTREDPVSEVHFMGWQFTSMVINRVRDADFTEAFDKIGGAWDVKRTSFQGKDFLAG